MKKIIASICCSLISAFVFADFPVDENRFFLQPVDFSPATEKYLDEQWLAPPPEVYPFAHGEVKKRDGAPWPFIDGQPIKAFTRAIQKNLTVGMPVTRLMRENGMTVFILDVVVVQDDKDVLAGFKRVMDVLLATAPDVKVIIRFGLMGVPLEFIEQYPEAVLTGEDGKTDWGWGYHSTTHTQRANYLNEWRRYNGKFLYNFIRAAGKSHYAPHIAGFYLMAMNSGEWWYNKGRGDVGWDYSPGRKAAFRHFLNAKYGENHVEILKKLWNVDSAGEVYRLPTLKERKLLPMTPCSKVSDYHQVLNLPVTNAAIYFARVIKAQTSGRCLAGMEIHAGLATFKNNGTVFQNQLLDAPEIDFLGGPANYYARGVGNYPQERAMHQSFRLHNKFWFAEEDIRPHTAHGTRSGAQGNPPLSRDLTLSMVRRQFAAGACRGYPGYLMSFGWYWFLDPEIARTVRECNTIGEYLNNAGKLKRDNQIALVSDQESQLYANYYANPTLIRNYNLSRTGLDYDFFELRDFLKPGVAKLYKMVIFLNIRALSDEERAAIDTLKNQHRTLVFLHDPGFVSLNRPGINPAWASALSGIELSGSGQRVKGKVIYDSAALRQHLRIDAGLPEETIEARKTTARNVSYSDAIEDQYVGNILAELHSVDPKSLTLGRDDKSNAIVVMKKFPEWTSIYGAACLLPPLLLRALAEYSGIKPASDHPDIVFSAGDVVAIHAVSDGKRKITMPKRGDVFELFSRQVVAKDTETFEYDFKFGDTRMFVSGDTNAVITGLEALERKESASIAAFKAKYPAPEMATAFFKRQRSQRPESYFGVRKQKIDTRYGNFPLGVYLVADASVTTEPVRALKEGPIPDLYSDASRLNTMRSGKPPLQWEGLALDRPFVFAQELGIGKGQRGKAAFYLCYPAGKRIKMLFTSTDRAKLFINNIETVAPEEGEVIALPGESSLFVIELDNPDGNAGFGIKFYEPDATAARGEQRPFNRMAKDLQVRLAP